MNRLRRRVSKLALVLGLFTLAGGCSPGPASSPHSKSQTSTPAKRQQAVRVQSLAVVQAAADKRLTPKDTVLNEVRWKLSSGVTISPRAANILWQSEVADFSILAVNVPSVQPAWRDFFFMSRDPNGTWRIQGIMDGPLTDPQSVDTLSLPMKKATQMKLSIPSIGRAWAFENGHYAVVVVEAGNVPIDPTAYRELPTRHGVGLYQWSDGASTLSYSDAGKRIWIAGNIKQEDSQRFANRLPEVTSAFFPLRSQSGN